MCRNSSMMDFDFLSTSSSDRAGLSGVWTGSDFTVGVKTTVKTVSLWKSDQSLPLDIIYIYILFSCMCPSPDSLTLLRSGSVLSSVTLVLRGSAPSRSRSLRGSSAVWFSSSSLELPPLMNSPGRDDGGPEISGFSLRSLPEVLRLMGRKIKQANKSVGMVLHQRD